MAKKGKDNDDKHDDDSQQEEDDLQKTDKDDDGEEQMVTNLHATISPRGIVQEMEESYLTYAMSVIVMRALPDVRDGLKPVHRRILYAMKDIGLSAGSKFKKSAAVVGEVLGKYHPHGDTAVYDSMVRMAQDFSLRYMLVHGQGNFGSIDGDNAAAMRYTEAKLRKISDDVMADIEKDTVDFRPNYDGNHKEPVVLPSRVPQLLLNGTVGIAVGMATNIPPHNLNEVIDATVRLIEEPEATIDNLMEHIQGPDFPTGATIYDKEAIKIMYATGRGGITVRAVTTLEEMKGGRMRIVVSQIPYQVNKANLITKIADLVRDKRIVGISGLRDESDRRDKVRIVIELKKDAFPKKILNQLFKYTSLQTNFNMNMIALVNGIQPQLLNLKGCLQHFIDHRKEVVTRRTKYELKIAEARAHILEGLKKALDDIDKIIQVIKKSKDRTDARLNLMKKWKFSELQANAILDMRLQTLAGLERKSIEDELKEKLDLIKDLKEILASPQLVLDIIKDELVEIKEKYGDERRTQVIPHALGKMSAIDTVPNEPMIVALTRQGYIKRVSPTQFKSQRRGGKGVIGTTTKEEDEVTQLVFTHNHDFMLYFTNFGRVFRLQVYEVPQASKTAKGTAIVNLLALQSGEEVTTMMTMMGEIAPDRFLIMATREGTIKKTPLKDFENVRKSGLIAIKIKSGDSLNWVKEVEFKDQVMLTTHEGKGIRFLQTEVRPMGRASQGVRGIRVINSDRVVDLGIVKDEKKDELFVIMENGLGKATKVAEYRLQSRGGSGVKTANVTAKTGKIAGARVLSDKEGDLIMISKNGQTIRLKASEAPSLGRATQGVRLMKMKADDMVASVSLVPSLEDVLKNGIKDVKSEIDGIMADVKAVAA